MLHYILMIIFIINGVIIYKFLSILIFFFFFFGSDFMRLGFNLFTNFFLLRKLFFVTVS